MAWTDYGRQQMFYVGMGIIPAPTLYVALYSTTANPASAPTELTLAGYNRQSVTWVLESTDNLGNAADVTFGPLQGGSFIGVAILDDPAAGQPWMWNDESGAVAIGSNSLVTFAAGLMLAQRTSP